CGKGLLSVCALAVENNARTAKKISEITTIRDGPVSIERTEYLKLTSQKLITTIITFDSRITLRRRLPERDTLSVYRQKRSIARWRISTHCSSSGTGTNSPVRWASRMLPGPKTTAAAPSAI